MVHGMRNETPLELFHTFTLLLSVPTFWKSSSQKSFPVRGSAPLLTCTGLWASLWFLALLVLASDWVWMYHLPFSMWVTWTSPGLPFLIGKMGPEPDSWVPYIQSSGSWSRSRPKAAGESFVIAECGNSPGAPPPRNPRTSSQQSFPTVNRWFQKETLLLTYAPVHLCGLRALWLNFTSSLKIQNPGGLNTPKDKSHLP